MTGTGSTSDLERGAETAASGREGFDPCPVLGDGEPGGVESSVAASGAPAGEAGMDGANGSSASAQTGRARPRVSAAAGVGGVKQRSTAPRAADGQPQAPTVSNGVGVDEPKFTADGRPIRKVPFPGDAAALGPKTATARPALQAAGPRGGERARLPWLVPTVVALILVFAAVVAWRLLALRASEEPSSQPGEGHSSLQETDHPRDGAAAAPPSATAGHSAVPEGYVASRSGAPRP